MSDRAVLYQSQITGREPGWVYRVQGVKFDGYDAGRGVLLDAKGLGYARFVDNASGIFKSWWRGSNGLLDEAQRQITAANGIPIEWHVAEEQAYNAISSLLNGNGIQTIQVIFTPPLP